MPLSPEVIECVSLFVWSAKVLNAVNRIVSWHSGKDINSRWKLLSIPVSDDFFSTTGRCALFFALIVSFFARSLIRLLSINCPFSHKFFNFFSLFVFTIHSITPNVRYRAHSANDEEFATISCLIHHHDPKQKYERHIHPYTCTLNENHRRKAVQQNVPYLFEISIFDLEPFYWQHTNLY